MSQQKEFVANALEATVRIGILLVLAAWCFSIVQPFVIPIVWGVIIAVAEYPGYLKLRAWLGGRATTAATLLTALGLLVLLVPAVLLGGTLVDGAHGLAKGLEEGTLAVPPPPPESVNLKRAVRACRGPIPARVRVHAKGKSRLCRRR